MLGKTGVKLTTLELCFGTSQVKIHGPLSLPLGSGVDNIQEVEDDKNFWIAFELHTQAFSSHTLHCKLNSFIQLLKALKIQ